MKNTILYYKSLKDVVEKAFEQTSSIHKHVVSHVTSSQAKSVRVAHDINLTGYKHVVDHFAIRHTIKNHGDAKKESSRGQVAVTLDDFFLIKKVINKPDKISVEKNRRGQLTLVYEKKIGDVYIYIEEVRTHKELVMASMRKRKAPLK